MLMVVIQTARFVPYENTYYTQKLSIILVLKILIVGVKDNL